MVLFSITHKFPFRDHLSVMKFHLKLIFLILVNYSACWNFDDYGDRKYQINAKAIWKNIFGLRTSQMQLVFCLVPYKAV